MAADHSAHLDALGEAAGFQSNKAKLAKQGKPGKLPIGPVVRPETVNLSTHFARPVLGPGGKKLPPVRLNEYRVLMPNNFYQNDAGGSSADRPNGAGPALTPEQSAAVRSLLQQPRLFAGVPLETRLADGKRIAAIDMLRGLAAALMLLDH